MDNRTEQLADGVWRVEAALYVNAYVLEGEDGLLTLVDAGTSRGGPRLVRSIRLLGLDARRVSDLLFTHWHPDHTGSAARFERSSAAPRLHAGAADQAVVQGSEPPRPPATTRLGRLVARMSPRPSPAARVATLSDGQRFPSCGGLEVVATPGHTSGHCSFWLPARGVLLAGDAVANVLRFARNPRFLTADVGAAERSLRRLAELPCEVVAPGHGPPVRSGGQDRLIRLAERRTSSRLPLR